MKRAFNPNKVISIELLKAKEADEFDKDIPFGCYEAKPDRVVFFLDVDRSYQSDKIEVNFDSYEEAEAFYHIVTDEYHFIKL